MNDACSWVCRCSELTKVLALGSIDPCPERRCKQAPHSREALRRGHRCAPKVAGPIVISRQSDPGRVKSAQGSDTRSSVRRATRWCPPFPFRASIQALPRTYVPYKEKHKWPKGFGSLCPRMPDDVPRELLMRAVPVPGVGANKLWVASGRWCFCAHPSSGDDVWHGFPVIGGDVDERVWSALEAAALISPAEIRTLRKQRALPEMWP